MDFALLFGKNFFSPQADSPSPSVSRCDSSSSRVRLGPIIAAHLQFPPVLLLAPHHHEIYFPFPGLRFYSVPASSSSSSSLMLPLFFSPAASFTNFLCSPYPYHTPVKPCFSFPPFSSHGILFTIIPRLRAAPRRLFRQPRLYSFFIMFELNLHLDRRWRPSGSLSREAGDSR